MLDPWIHADGALCREQAVFAFDTEMAVAAAKLEQELVLRMRVRNQWAADEVHRGAAKTALQNPDGFIYVMRYCRDAQDISSWNRGTRAAIASFY